MKRENAWAFIGILIGFVGAILLYKIDKTTALKVGEAPLFFGGPVVLGAVGYLMGLKKKE